jgi:DNA-binding transcriptional LysR family regulator
MESAPRGTLKLNLPFAFGRMHIAPLIPEFLTRYPDVRIHLTGNNRFIDLVDEGADLAIRIGKLADSSLIAKRLAPNRLVVCGAPAYFDRMGVPQQPADLTRHNCLIYTYRSARDQWRFLGPDGAEKVVQVSGNLETNDGDTAREIMLAGLGIAHMPLWLIGHELRSGRLIEVLSNYDAPDSAIYAVYPPARHLSPKVRSFVDFLAERFSREDAWCSGC